MPGTTQLKKDIGTEKFFWSLELLNRWILENENEIKNKYDEINVFVDSNKDQIVDKKFVDNIEEMKQTLL